MTMEDTGSNSHHREGAQHSPRRGVRAATVGGLYALVLTVLGFMLPVIFFIEGQDTDNGLYLAIFHIYIYTVSLFFLLYLQCCLMTKRRKKSDSMDEDAASMDFDMLDEHGFKDTLPLPSREPEVDTMTPPTRGDVSSPLNVDDVKDDAPPFAYTGDGVNFLFRFGVIVLGMGSVILDGFRLLQFVETKAAWLCYGNFFLVDTVLRLVFVFAETFFIFKNHKLVVNFKTSFVRFGLVHLVATNLCIWAMVVVMETTESYKLLNRDTPGNLEGAPVVLPTAGPGGVIEGPLYMNVSLQIHRLCHGRHTLADKAAPYLYPAAVQFCLLAAAVLARMFTKVGGSTWRLPQVPPQRRGGFCHKANTGLFLGLIVVVLTLIVTCFFLLDRAGHLPLDRLITTLVFFCNDLAVLAVSLLVVLIAFCKVRKLRYEELAGDQLHQCLQFVGVGGYYAFYICVMVPAIRAVAGGQQSGEELLNSQLLVVVCALAAVQATAQVTFIVDALRRRAASRQQVKAKPGRSLVTFLLICNLAMWIIDSFQLKELHTSHMLLSFYGQLSWQVLIHVFLPLAVLFRFHSAVCYADIFSKAYKKRPENFHNTSFAQSDTDEHRVQHIG